VCTSALADQTERRAAAGSRIYAESKELLPATEKVMLNMMMSEDESKEYCQSLFKTDMPEKFWDEPNKKKVAAILHEVLRKQQVGNGNGAP